ncbi:GNAT family N-acetyltransferase [Oceanithermus sp.]
MLRIRSTTPDDAAVLARFRVMLFGEMGRLEGDEAEFAHAAENYFAWALSTGREVAWIAEDLGGPVAVLAMTLEPMPPKPGRPRLMEAYMHNVYALPEHRLCGLAERLVRAALTYAEKEGVRRVRLYTSDDARPLYEKLGFVPHTRYPERKL